MRILKIKYKIVIKYLYFACKIAKQIPNCHDCKSYTLWLLIIKIEPSQVKKLYPSNHPTFLMVKIKLKIWIKLFYPHLLCFFSPSLPTRASSLPSPYFFLAKQNHPSFESTTSVRNPPFGWSILWLIICFLFFRSLFDRHLQQLPLHNNFLLWRIYLALLRIPHWKEMRPNKDL